MDKESRLELIREVFHRTRGKRKELSPELWELVQELKEETVEFSQPATVVEFQDSDVLEEVQYLDGYHRQLAEVHDAEWETFRLIENDFSPKPKRVAVAN